MAPMKAPRTLQWVLTGSSASGGAEHRFRTSLNHPLAIRCPDWVSRSSSSEMIQQA